jgi:hypothetical protein
MNNQAYEIVRRGDGRNIISDPATGTVLDDAQGWGYKTKQKAAAAAWYKFKGGKAKMDAGKQEATRFWRKNQAFAEATADLVLTCFKEIARGEMDEGAAVSQLATRMGVEGFDPKFLKYMP